MIPNQPYLQQTAVMPDYYQQNLMSSNQAEINKPAENVTAPMTHYNCCVDLSHMHHFHDMHGFHHMLDYHHMHDFHPYYMHEFDHQMHDDHYDPHDGWDMTSMDYHHEWFHPYDHPHHPYHMHYMHPMCYPVVCYPAEKKQQGKP